MAVTRRMCAECWPRSLRFSVRRVVSRSVIEKGGAFAPPFYFSLPANNLQLLHFGPDRTVAAAFYLLYCGLRCLEADLGVGAVTKRFVHRAATATQRDARLAGQVVSVTIG